MEINYFFSPNCTICEAQKNILSVLQDETHIPVHHFNIFTDLDKALKYGVKSAPALSLLVEGKSLEVMTGFQSRERIDERIQYWKKIVQ